MVFRLPRLVPLRDARRAVAMRLGPDLRGELHFSGSEDPRVHDAQLTRDAWLEAHVRDHVALGLEPGRNLDQLEPFGAHPEHGALGDEERELACPPSNFRAVADLF